MVTQALTAFHDGPKIHFVSNIDSSHITDVLKNLDPEKTLVLIASKTFTTIETMTNANTAQKWMKKALGEENASQHFVAISTALEKLKILELVKIVYLDIGIGLVVDTRFGVQLD